VSAWILMATWGLVNLIFTVANWWARIRYERVRAASIATVSRVISAGGSVSDQRADGTVLYIDIPTRQAEVTYRPSDSVPCEVSDGRC
jgi:hypothetical protein